jgi:hypothetical protein
MNSDTVKVVTQRPSSRLRTFIYAAFAFGFGFQVFFFGYSTSLLSFLLPFLVFVSFSSLTTTLHPDRLVASFFFGFPSRTIYFSDVTVVSVLEVSRWFGYGIRVMPDGFMWRVSGRQVIRIRLSSGRSFYLGVPNPYFFAGGPLSDLLDRQSPAEHKTV